MTAWQPHALVASYDVPRFDRDSGSKRTFDLLNHLLAEGWRVTYLATNPLPPGGERYVQALRRRGVPFHEGHEAAETIIASAQFDLALFAFWQVAELLLPWVREVSPGTRVVVDSVDVQFTRYIRRLQSLGPGELLDADDAEEFRGEMNTYLAADAVITVSEREADLLNLLTGRSDLAFAVPDQEELALGGPGFAGRRGLVFVGTYRWAPNVDAVRFAAREVLPLVDAALLAEHPLHVVGDGLDRGVLDLIDGAPGIVPVGWVPDVVPYLHAARAALVPLRYGAGTKRKTIQSLAAGTPTVATSIGAEGLDLLDGSHVLVADEAEDLARAIERVLTDEELWMKLRREGAAHVATIRSPAVARDALLRVVDSCMHRDAGPSAARNQPRQAAAARYTGRLVYQGAQAALPEVRELVDRHVARGAAVLVATDGLAGVRRMGGPNAEHFPQQPDGTWRRERPPSTEALLDELSSHVRLGATHLLVPTWVGWFLDQYPGIEERLEEVGAVGAGTLYLLPGVRPARLTQRASPTPAPAAAGTVGGDPAVEAPRLVAFYLPQFHPIPENDEWWGRGFTEWSNVAAAAPLFAGHHQPHVPADLGFYDLRFAETRAAQAELAREYGISAFCYYHYWFGGRRLLERPFTEVLASGEPDFPFTLCWANEPWSRRWDGRDHEVLMDQAYSPADDLDHIRTLLPALADPRAVRVGDRVLLTIYQAWSLPDARRTTDTWREEVSRAGLGDLYLCAVETGWDEDQDVTALGFDAKIGFQPQFTFLDRVPRLPVGPPTLRVFDYEAAWRYMSKLNEVPYRRYETVAPRWDNSPRRGADGWVLHGSSPDSYERWLTEALERAMREPPEHRLVFINAWNEWGEGAHLEPELEHGHGYLAATARALADVTARHGMAVTEGRRR